MLQHIPLLTANNRPKQSQLCHKLCFAKQCRGLLLWMQAINVLGKKARDGTISIDDMAGGTFTISNGGVYGSMLSTPIINPPQSAILGMHAITQRATVVRTSLEARACAAILTAPAAPVCSRLAVWW